MRALLRLVAMLVTLAVIGCGQAEPPQPPVTSTAPPPEPRPGAEAPPVTAPPPATSTAKPPQTPAPAGSNAPAPALPAFPWPPPRYSAFSRIDRAAIAPGDDATLASAATRLEHAFDAAGYGERSYYRIPGGFALVSRIEQIRADATPIEPPARWAAETAPVRGGFIDQIRALFNAPPGLYRVIVFTVTDQDFAASDRPPTSSEAREWVSSGAMRLPDSIGARPYSAAHYTTALIYEFERRADQEAHVKAPSNSPGRVHLEKAGLWQALAGR